MLLREFIVLAFILHNLIVQLAAARFQIDEKDDDDDDDGYRFLKRFIFDKSTAASTKQTPSVIDNLIYPLSTLSSTTKQPSTWPQKSTYSPSNPCSSNPCEHGGICTPKGQMTYECKCVGPWRGINCGVANACYKSPCENGGICLNVHDNYWCKCTNDYYGTNCQTKFYNPSHLENNCQSNICNTGRCVSLKTTYYCECPDDRYGVHCEKGIYKRGVSTVQSYYNLLHQLKHSMAKHDMKDIQKSPKGHDIAYYDVKNGIYF